jgi:FkbM family methyltransferase
VSGQVVEIESRAGKALGLVRDPGDYIQQHWLRGRFFEERLLEYIYWHFKGRVFVDVGSNVGNHSLFFAKFCQPKMVVSVEPHAGAVAHQREVMELNGVAKAVRTFDVALSDREGRGAMRPWESNPALRSGSMTLVEGDEVDVTTLDSLGLSGVNVAKIDVEGHEMAVLRGGREFLERCRPHLFVEVLSRKAYQGVKAFLEGLGYKQVGDVFQDARTVEFAA